MNPWRIAFLVGAAFLVSKRGRELAKRTAQEVVKGSAEVARTVERDFAGIERTGREGLV